MNKKIKILIITGLVYFLGNTNAFAALSCVVSDNTCDSNSVMVLRMNSESNSHAELASESNYSKVVCCVKDGGLVNSCNGNYEIVAKLSDTTDAHVEIGTETTYSQNVCLSVSDSTTLAVAYQDNNCDGYDTTLFSMSKFPTNAHIGGPDEYVHKVCAKMVVPSIIGFFSGGSTSSNGAVAVASGTTTSSEVTTVVSTNSDSLAGQVLSGLSSGVSSVASVIGNFFGGQNDSSVSSNSVTDSGSLTGNSNQVASTNGSDVGGGQNNQNQSSNDVNSNALLASVSSAITFDKLKNIGFLGLGLFGLILGIKKIAFFRKILGLR